jgi:hypothetical protein
MGRGGGRGGDSCVGRRRIDEGVGIGRRSAFADRRSEGDELGAVVETCSDVHGQNLPAKEWKDRRKRTLSTVNRLMKTFDPVGDEGVAIEDIGSLDLATVASSVGVKRVSGRKEAQEGTEKDERVLIIPLNQNCPL